MLVVSCSLSSEEPILDQLRIIAKSETYQVDTSNVLFILSGAFVGLDKIVLGRMSKGVSCFLHHFPYSF